MKVSSFIALTAMLISCGKAPTPCSSSVSTLHSGNNGVQCDVSYGALKTDRLAGINITDNNVKPTEKVRHLNELNSMPTEFLDIMRGGIRVALTEGGITNLPEYANLKGVQPRGWPDGQTWDIVPGAGAPTLTALGDSFMTNGAQSLAIHEGSHSVASFSGIDKSPEFLAAWNAEKGRPHSSDYAGEYRTTHIEEYMAMAIDDYYCSKSTRERLKTMYPKAYAFVENDMIRLLKASGKGKAAPVPETKPDPVVDPAPETKPVPDQKPAPDQKPVPDQKPAPEIGPVENETGTDTDGNSGVPDDGTKGSEDSIPALPDPPLSHGKIKYKNLCQ